MSGDPFASSAAYRAKGWVGTLPLPLGRKTPPPAGFTGDGGAWPSPADLADWAEQAPQNIALRLPPNVIALDVDDTAAFLALAELVGPLPATWRAHSGGDRLGHLYYRLPAGVVSTGWGAPCPGVDLLRHGHRYSIVAPSVHPSGTTYTWAPPDGSAGGTDIPGPGDLPELPAAWVDYLSGDSDDPDAPRAGSTLGPAGDLGTPIPDGAHDSTITAYVWRLRHRVSEGEAYALARLRGRDCVPPTWTDAMSDQKVRTAYAKEVEEVGPEPVWPAYEAAIAGAPAVSAPAQWTWVDWFSLWAEPEEDDWILRPFIPARRAVALYSAPKLGKSLLLLEIAVAISRGTPVMGIAPERQPVLYVDFENDMRGDIRRRLRTMGISPTDLGELRYLSFPTMGYLDTEAGGEQLLDAAKTAGTALVIIDTVGRTIKGEENANDTWLAFYRNTGRLLKEAGIAYVRLDHSGKDDTKGMRGGSAKSSDVDAVWQLTKTGLDELLLYCEAPRMHIPEEERAIGLRRVTDPFLRHERVAAPTKLNADLITQCAIDLALDDAGVVADPLAAGMTIRALTETCAQAGVKNTNKAGFGNLLRTVLGARKNRENAFYQPPEYTPEHLAAARQMLGLERKGA